MATQPFWALTLVTLLLMLEKLLTLLGTVVMRIGVLRSPRVTSTRGMRGTQGLPQPQPGRFSYTPGERLWTGCLAAARTLPQQWALNSGTGEGLRVQPRDKETRPLSHPGSSSSRHERVLSSAPAGAKTPLVQGMGPAS